MPAQPITNLRQLLLGGAVSGSGDSVQLSTGSTTYSASGDNAVNAAEGWQRAEFNEFGHGGSGQASFNRGSTIVPRTIVIHGGKSPPVCVGEGYTAETNNLSFGPGAPSTSQPGAPSLLFTESSSGASPANCDATTTVGGAPDHSLWVISTAITS